jgi:pimeloyl-ACP methyl ester carboxylesterase
VKRIEKGGGEVMEVNQRFFQLEEEWNVIHLPERPNGFGVLVLGDKNHFVEENTSFWIQNAGRFQMLDYLLYEGYTVFYSNLYGEHWGSPHAFNLAKRLYHVVLKNEILNDKIHILAEGMGALIALQLMESMQDKIRSVAMLNPCIDVKAHLQHEKQHKFFYKRLRQMIASAYHIPDNEVENIIKSSEDFRNFTAKTPVKIWQITNSSPYPSQLHSRVYEKYRRELNAPIALTLHLAEKRFSLSPSICRFFHEHEKQL